MSLGNVVMIAGWAHTSNALLPLADLLPCTGNKTVLAPSDLYLHAPDRCQKALQKEISCYAEGLHKTLLSIDSPRIIIGWSMGAIIAIETISSFNLQFDSLILIAGTAKFCSTNEYSSGVSPGNLLAMKRKLKTNTSQTLKTFFTDTTNKVKQNNNIIDRKVSDAQSLGQEILLHGLDYLYKTDMRSKLSSIKQPVLIVHGSDDKIIPQSAGYFLNKGIENSQLICQNNAGHNIPESDTKNIADLIVSFAKKGKVGDG